MILRSRLNAIHEKRELMIQRNRYGVVSTDMTLLYDFLHEILRLQRTAVRHELICKKTNTIESIMALPLPPGLTPPEVAFLCEMEMVTVIPRQRLDRLELLGVSSTPQPKHSLQQ